MKQNFPQTQKVISLAKAMPNPSVKLTADGHAVVFSPSRSGAAFLKR